MTEFPILTAEESRRIVFTLLSDEQRARFEKDWELDFSVTVDQVSRFRANVLIQKNGIESRAAQCHRQQNTDSGRPRIAYGDHGYGQLPTRPCPCDGPDRFRQIDDFSLPRESD